MGKCMSKWCKYAKGITLDRTWTNVFAEKFSEVYAMCVSEHLKEILQFPVIFSILYKICL